MNETSVNSQPRGNWSFDKGVVDVFDNMVARSVPLYEQTIDLAAKFSKYHPGKVVDLGCATGNVAKAIGVKVVCVDCSVEMLDKCKEKNPEAEIVKSDLRLGLPAKAEGGSFYTMLWTAQFIPIEHRQALFGQIAAEIKKTGGGFFLAEKLRGQNSNFQRVIVDQYHNWKRDTAGYSVEQIAAKSKSLENSLVSFDAPGLKACLTAEGFKVEEVIRYLGFAAWYCYV